jgi:hypothetical protein
MPDTVDQKFSEKLKRFTAIDQGKSIKEISLQLGWPRTVVSLYKYRFPVLTKEELAQLDSVDSTIDYEILGAICLYSLDNRQEMIRRIIEIQKMANPFELIDEIMAALKQEHPLEKLSLTYWKEVADYLTDRGIDKAPFYKRTIGFIRSLNWKGGFKGQNEKQRKWIIDLMIADKKGFGVSAIFNNDFLKVKGLEKDYILINKFYECL